jgi:hypothetical protein
MGWDGISRTREEGERGAVWDVHRLAYEAHPERHQQNQQPARRHDIRTRQRACTSVHMRMKDRDA